MPQVNVALPGSRLGDSASWLRVNSKKGRDNKRSEHSCCFRTRAQQGSGRCVSNTPSAGAPRGRALSGTNTGARTRCQLERTGGATLD